MMAAAQATKAIVPGAQALVQTVGRPVPAISNADDLFP